MSSTPLFDFTAAEPSPASDWRTINDDVMGGVSESQFKKTEAGAAFTGTVSLKHGGGFASVRGPENGWNLSAHDGLSLRLRGDGQCYKLTTYTVPGGPISYRTRLHPPPEWTTVHVPFADLVPYRRGTKRPDAPPFDPSQLRTVGFLIADEQDGPFRLEIARIWATEAPEAS
jgi:monofunctional biosynthetic peptidoglycan transglycosylase